MSSAQTRRSFSPSGTSPATIRCASPSAIAVLPTPGSPISTGLFFVRRERIWITRRISSSRPITGSSLPCLGGLGQVAAELLERLVAALGILRRDALPAAHLLDPREDLVARHRLEREEEVLGRDEVVLELLALLVGARRARCENAADEAAAGCCRAARASGAPRASARRRRAGPASRRRAPGRAARAAGARGRSRGCRGGAPAPAPRRPPPGS